MTRTKILLFIFCLIFVITSMVDAQIIKSIGLNAGYVYAKQNWSYTPQSIVTASGIEPISGFSGGAFVEFFDVPNFSLLTKLLYVAKGRIITVIATRIDPNDPKGYVDIGYQQIRDRLDYISIPVLFKLRFETPIFEPFIAIGPRFEYLISHPSSVVFNNFKTTEWTGTISVGTEMSFNGFPKFVVEASYNTSFTDSYKNEFLTISDRYYDIMVGVIL